MTEVFEAVAHRDGKWWTFKIPALSSPSPRGGGHRIVAMGQARTAAEVESVARDLAATWMDVDDPAAIDIRVTYRLPDPVGKNLERAESLETRGRAAISQAVALRRSAARALTEAGLSQSDAATVLGLSRQRVQQLVTT